MNVLLLLGVGIFFGTLGGRIFQRLKIPQVVGYIIVGLLLGQSFLGVLDIQILDLLDPLVSLALAIIGFLIGSELKIGLFKKYGKTIYSILLGEGLTTFLVVTILVWLLTKKFYFGIILGALASATAPAATVDVLWEYKARGPLTRTLFSIVALDDALALIMYGFASAFSRSLISKEHTSWLYKIEAPFLEIGLALIIGFFGGYLLSKLLGFIKERERILPFSLGVIILVAGISVFWKVDLILSSMVAGFILANLAPLDSKEIFEEIKRFATPIYVIFFVIVGARLDISLFFKAGIATLAIVYVLARTLGKMAGAYLGALIGKAQDAVRKYLGICLFSQAGVAIGLALSIYHNLSQLSPQAEAIGLVIINVITATTFIVQIIGPPAVKFAIQKAGETWRDITEEDIIATHKVSDYMLSAPPLVRQNTPLYHILETFKNSEIYYICVVDAEDKLQGLISLGDLREVFLEQDIQNSNIIIASDIMKPVVRYLTLSQPLQDAIYLFQRRELDFLPVVESGETMKLAGVMQYHSVMKKIQEELLTRRGADI